MTCNFQEFLVYDMEQPNGEPEQILLENLGKEYYRLQFLVDVKSEHLRKEMEVSMQAGEIVGRIYEALLEAVRRQLPKPCAGSTSSACASSSASMPRMQASSATTSSTTTWSRYDAEDMRNALRDLFEVLNTPRTSAANT